MFTSLSGLHGIREGRAKSGAPLNFTLGFADKSQRKDLQRAIKIVRGSDHNLQVTSMRLRHVLRGFGGKPISSAQHMTQAAGSVLGKEQAWGQASIPFTLQN